MKIGLDAKRIFNNGTGLGVYGRNLLTGLQNIDGENDYLLFTPENETKHFNVKALKPNFNIYNADIKSSYFWRTFSMVKDIRSAHLDIYHGLSNELPVNIKKTQAKSIVDIHDLCFVHFPKDYSPIDRQIFWHKAKRAANHSDKIIATSENTKADILQYFQVPEEKIAVVYQCCDDIFYATLSPKDLNTCREKYQLPSKFVLCVGTVQGRKNQKSIVNAMAKIPSDEQLPIILVGNGKRYLKELLRLAKKKNVQVRVLKKTDTNDLPGIYQLASLFVYPSFVEGFGIPVLEAMASKIPVITSKDTSMAEIIQNEDALIDPNNEDDLKEKILAYKRGDLQQHVAKNLERSKAFSQNKFAQDVLKIYEDLCGKKK